MKIHEKHVENERLAASEAKSADLILCSLSDVFYSLVNVESKRRELDLLISPPFFLYDLMKCLCSFVELPQKEVRARHHIGFSYCNDLDSEMPVFVRDGEDFILSGSRLIFVKSDLGSCYCKNDASGINKEDTVFELIDLSELPRRRIFYREGIMNTYDFEAPYIGHSLTLKKIETQQKKQKDRTIYVRKPMKEMVRESLECFAENIVDLEEYDWIWNLEFIQEALANYQKLKIVARDKGWLEGIELRDFELKNGSSNKEADLEG